MSASGSIMLYHCYSDWSDGMKIVSFNQTPRHNLYTGARIWGRSLGGVLPPTVRCCVFAPANAFLFCGLDAHAEQ